MYRRGILSLSAIMALALVVPQGSAVAQTKSLKDQLLGTWNLLLVDNVKSDNTETGLYGANPIGTVIFTADGHYSLQLMRSNLPKIASGDRLKETPAEEKAIAEGTLSHFGTYTVNDADKTFTIRIDGSTFPNWEGTKQTRKITSITDDTVPWDNSHIAAPSLGGARSALAWRKAK